MRNKVVLVKNWITEKSIDFIFFVVLLIAVEFLVVAALKGRF
jgi:hypothetical protein